MWRQIAGSGGSVSKYQAKKSTFCDWDVSQQCTWLDYIILLVSWIIESMFKSIFRIIGPTRSKISVIILSVKYFTWQLLLPKVFAIFDIITALSTSLNIGAAWLAKKWTCIRIVALWALPAFLITKSSYICLYRGINY